MANAGHIVPIGDSEYEALVKNLDYPIEETVSWDDYDALLPERELWKQSRWAYVPDAAAQPRAVITLRHFTIHKMKFLWSRGGPVWVGEPLQQDEEIALTEALREFVKVNDPSIDFIRLGLFHDNPHAVMPCQDLYFHDTTVMIDTSGDEDAIRSRMKSRGRQDVNKAKRESQAVISDETDITREQFEELLGVLQETGDRQGFNAQSDDSYWRLFALMRDKGMARLFVGREDDKAINWCFYIIHDHFATYEIAASTDYARRNRAPDLLLYSSLLELQKSGITKVDLVAIGSDYNPKLNTLNQFKTKWSKETTRVGAPMELVLKPFKYRALNKLASLLHR